MPLGAKMSAPWCLPVPRSVGLSIFSVNISPGGRSVRAYIMTTGTVFGLITLAHVLRIFTEGRQVATDPWFVLLTVAAAALGIWAWRLLRRPTGA